MEDFTQFEAPLRFWATTVINICLRISIRIRIRIRIVCVITIIISIVSVMHYLLLWLL